MMGFIDSPYHVHHVVTWGKCIALGYIWNLENIFEWEKAVFNLPGQPHMTANVHGSTRKG